MAEQLSERAREIERETVEVGREAKGIAMHPESAQAGAEFILRRTEKLSQATAEVAEVADALNPKTKSSGLAKKSMPETARYNRYLETAEAWLGEFGIHGTSATVALLSVVLVLAVLLKMLTQFLNQYLLTKAGMKVVMDVRNEMFAHLQRQSLAFHGRSDVGKLMSRASADPETIRTLISQTMSDLCRAPFEVLSAVGFVAFFAVRNNMVSLLLIAVLGYPLCMLPVVWLGRMIRRWSQRLLEQSAGIGSNFHENLTCIRVVKAYNTEQSEIVKYAEANRQALKLCLRAVRLSILVTPLTEAVAIVLAAVFIVYCFLTGHGMAEIVPLVPPSSSSISR